MIDVTQNFATLQTSTISAGRVFEMMDRDDYEPKQAGSLKEIGAGRYSFLSMYFFSYDGKRDVLKDISFEVKNGQTIAFLLVILGLVNPLLSISSCAL